MAAFPLVPTETADPIVEPVFDRLRQRWGRVLNLYRVLAWSPKLVRGWSAFAWTLRFDLAVSRRLRELLVIRIANLTGAAYEYGHHLGMAKAAGVSEAQVAALEDWRASDLFDEKETLVLELADELASSPGATVRTMSRLRTTFSPAQVVELVVTGAFYCGVARIVNSFEIELEDGHESLSPRKE